MLAYWRKRRRIKKLEKRDGEKKKFKNKIRKMWLTKKNLSVLGYSVQCLRINTELKVFNARYKPD
jgi:hypothetical protein